MLLLGVDEVVEVIVVIPSVEHNCGHCLLQICVPLVVVLPQGLILSHHHFL